MYPYPSAMYPYTGHINGCIPNHELFPKAQLLEVKNDIGSFSQLFTLGSHEHVPSCWDWSLMSIWIEPLGTQVLRIHEYATSKHFVTPKWNGFIVSKVFWFEMVWIPHETWHCDIFDIKSTGQIQPPKFKAHWTWSLIEHDNRMGSSQQAVCFWTSIVLDKSSTVYGFFGLVDKR